MSKLNPTQRRECATRKAARIERDNQIALDSSRENRHTGRCKSGGDFRDPMYAGHTKLDGVRKQSEGYTKASVRQSGIMLAEQSMKFHKIRRVAAQLHPLL